jgi:CRP/FNR family transcriptional regulator, anaerobic regulatory protein
MAFDTRFPSDLPQACELCPASRTCLAAGIPAAALGRACIPLPTPGKALLEAGDPASAIYIVRAGCLKSFTVDEDGNERVRGFHLPGDVIGLDALGARLAPASVVAVSAAQVCRIPAADVRRMVTQSPALAQRLLERTSRDLAQALALAGDYTAEQRVAAFLLWMDERLGAAGDVTLPMTRRDIANYLRLATETVCRVLTRLQKAGRIRSRSRTVRVLNDQALRAMAEPAGLARAA